MTKHNIAMKLVNGEETYAAFIQEAVPQAKKSLWIGTADIKNMHQDRGNGYRPFLKTLEELCCRGVEVRLLHAREPGPRFRADFDRLPKLRNSPYFERVLCPRVHFKCILVDCRRAYIGSANLTGAGMGPRSDKSRNFEMGIDTEDPATIGRLMELYESVFLGYECETCRFRNRCPDPPILTEK